MYIIKRVLNYVMINEWCLGERFYGGNFNMLSGYLFMVGLVVVFLMYCYFFKKYWWFLFLVFLIMFVCIYLDMYIIGVVLVGFGVGMLCVVFFISFKKFN